MPDIEMSTILLWAPTLVGGCTKMPRMFHTDRVKHPPRRLEGFTRTVWNLHGVSERFTRSVRNLQALSPHGLPTGPRETFGALREVSVSCVFTYKRSYSVALLVHLVLISCIKSCCKHGWGRAMGKRKMGQTPSTRDVAPFETCVCRRGGSG